MALELDGDHGDVVVLSEGLGCLGDGLSWLNAEFAGAIEAEKFAGVRLGFEDSVGDDGDTLSGSELEAGRFVRIAGEDAEREGGRQL